MFSVYLFGVSPEGYENISETKYLLFCILCGGYCGIMLILLLQKTVLCRAEISGSRWEQISWRDRGERPRICFTLFLFLYLALTAVSGVVSEYGAATLTGEARREGVLTISIYGFRPSFVMKSYRGRHRNVLCVFAAASVLLFDVICLLQLLNRNPLGLYPGDFTYADRYREYGGAFLGTTGNADLTSAFLSLMILFCCDLSAQSKKAKSGIRSLCGGGLLQCRDSGVVRSSRRHRRNGGFSDRLSSGCTGDEPEKIAGLVWSGDAACRSESDIRIFFSFGRRCGKR